MTTIKRDFAVYSLKLANKLRIEGFEIVGTGINHRDPKFTVFFFKDTVELRQAIARNK